MQFSQILQEKLLPFETLPPIVDGQNTDMYALERDTRHLYLQGMENIREKIREVCEGQDRVVMSQLWALGKKSQVSATECATRGVNGYATGETTAGVINQAPTCFPALVTHGFIVERMVDGYAVWEPCSPYLKDFWQVGIQVSNGHGFLLLPEHVFHANVNALLAMM